MQVLVDLVEETKLRLHAAAVGLMDSAHRSWVMGDLFATSAERHH